MIRDARSGVSEPAAATPPAIALGLAAALLAGGSPAEPFRPIDDRQVLEHVSTASGGAGELRRQWVEHPEDRELALRLVRRYIEMGRETADPRFFGWGEAMLAPWLEEGRASPDAWVLSATIRQNRHDFSGALSALARAIEAAPRSAQAWLTKAVIHEVQGEYPAALQSCLRLAQLAPGMVGATCLASTLSVTGQAEYALAQLQQALRSPDADTNTRAWALTVQADIAQRLGRRETAESSFLAALTLRPHDPYLLAAYADLLLDQKRHTAVTVLLRDQTRIDGLLLRLTLAEQALRSPAAAEHIEVLKARFAASRLRGDALHLGDESRFHLHLLGEPDAALALALRNWEIQREPRDARILLEAALAQDRPEPAVQPVLDFLARSRLQDVRLQKLTARLAKGPA